MAAAQRPPEIILVTYARCGGPGNVAFYVNVMNPNVHTYTSVASRRHSDVTRTTMYRLHDGGEVKRVNDHIASIRAFDAKQHAMYMADIMYRPEGPGAMQAEGHYNDLSLSD